MVTTEEKKLYEKTDAVLKSPFFIDKPVLEISVVLDCSVSENVLKPIVKDVIITLKKHDKKYTNVRLNVIKWQSDIFIESHVESMMGMIMKESYELMQVSGNTKAFGVLEDYLNKYHQRSKIVFLFTEGKFAIKNNKEEMAKLQPFLGRKIIVINCSNGKAVVENISDVLIKARMGDR